MSGDVPPLLVGLAVDVSGSMAESLAPAGSGLDAVREVVRELARRDRPAGGSAARVFAHGYGFGNPISAILGRTGPAVRDLLALPGRDGPVSVVDLADDWASYEEHLRALAPDMLGSTPMLDALLLVRERFAEELRAGEYRRPPVLFLLSDGVPDAGTADEVRRVARQLHDDGVVVVSCYVSASDTVEPRRLVAEPRPHWPEGASVMFDCASPVEPGSPLADHLTDRGWRIEPGSRLCARVDRSDVLEELTAAAVDPARRGPVEVVISYAHEDEELRARLEVHLALLRRQGVIGGWTDRRIGPGREWAEQVDRRVESAELVLLLVSADLLASGYGCGAELARALERHRDGAAVVVPVLLRPVDWAGTPFGHLAALPTDARPVTCRPTPEDGLADVAEGVRASVAELGRA